DLLRRTLEWRIRRALPALPPEEVNADGAGALQRRRVAPGLAAGGVDALAALSEGLGRGVEDVPLVGVARGQAEHAGAAAADHDRRPLRARAAARAQPAVARLVILADEVGVAGLQQAVDDRQRLLEAADPVVARLAEGRELLLVPTRADPQDEPAV